MCDMIPIWIIWSSRYWVFFILPVVKTKTLMNLAWHRCVWCFSWALGALAMQSRKAKQHFLQPPSSSFSATSLPHTDTIPKLAETPKTRKTCRLNWMESNGIRRSASLALFWHGAAWYLITEQVGRKKSMPQICETYETSWNRRTSTVSTKLMVERCSRWFLPKQSQRLKECVTDQPGLKWKPCGAVLNLDGVSDNWGPKGKAPRGCPAALNQDEPSQPSLTLATSLHHFFIHPSYALKSLPESSEFFFWEWHPTWC